MSNPAFKRGQVWHYNPSYEPTGHIQKGARPVIIIGNNVQNDVSSVLEVVCCTAQPKPYSPVNVKFTMNGVRNTALVGQPFPVNIFDLTEYVGELPEDVMDLIKTAILIEFALIDVPQPSYTSRETLPEDVKKNPTNKFYKRYPSLAPKEETPEECLTGGAEYGAG